MLRRILRNLFLPGPSTALPAGLPSLTRDQIAHLITTDEGLPHIDWGMATPWIAHIEPDQDARPALHRAVAAAWLDELRDALKTDSRRWRRRGVEGLAPLEGTVGPRVAEWSDRSLGIIHNALTKIRGSDPIPPVAVVTLATADEYYAFISHFYQDEGHFATSGGLYIRADADSFPLLVINAQTKWDLEATVAHELTHHALKGFEIPVWAEEGLTQMMEERVTGSTSFAVTNDVMARHRTLWSEIGFDRFLSGETFQSPEGEEQELSYHLAQALTRSLLSDRPAAFFAFARACRDTDAELAAKEHLGADAAELAQELLRVPGQ